MCSTYPNLITIFVKYQEMYDQAFQFQLDPNIPGSVMSEVKRILTKKQEQKNVKDRMPELVPTDLSANDFNGIVRNWSS